ncbi:hypothetical protein DLAC_11025 [Tieghemostelium lacteum]|uniref:Calmodulin n=1 Tax=Tieghemostelium lacteum TaxID=361077 RepID=A0A151Z2Z1_TIELA|nr:hypothetical protein DLAC_11025 [Tieghemostelium lacteum]|eukprot:KYQ88326.1 hypothetical protein DLAC_11025 [Tieghemostelium lacteum]
MVNKKDNKRKENPNVEKETKETTPKKTSPQVGGPIETRLRKKARETLDFISTGKTQQRQESLFNLLGENYTGPSEQQLKMIFNLFDVDKDGKIGAEELTAVLRSMNKRPLTKRIDKILNECDKNRNGTIECDEFIQYMQNKAIEKAKMLGLIDSEDEESEVEGGDTDEETDKTPKKKAANAKPKSATKKKEAKSGKKASATTTPKAVTKQPSFFAPQKKGSSIVHYYNPNAGVHSENNIEVDTHSNPVSAEYDLGVEGAFSEFTILFGLFYPFVDDMKCQDALKSKGFNIEITKNQKDFISKLGTADVAVVVPYKESDNTTTKEEFVGAVKNYHQTGKGLYLWSENEPFFCQTNWILEELLQCKAVGCDPGLENLKLFKPDNNNNSTHSKKQTFSSHLITSGLVTLFEGRTVSYIDKVPESMEVIATNSSDHPIIICSKEKSFQENCGRILVDTGFTKLLNEFFSAGIERYIKNACVWLLGIDQRFKLGLDSKASIQAPKETPVWQYNHGSWFDYDAEASKVVEECYQDWLLNPYIDVRSVKSGHWSYTVDFKQNKQTNLQHPSHTQRDIRRVLKKVVA